jgi:ABC-2 type transport system permease protein
MKAYRSKKVLTYETQSIYKTLINKEFKKFFGITIYAVNAGLGPVLLTILSLASLFYQDKIGDFLAQMVGVGLDIEVMVLLIVGFSVAMTYTPSITLSLEGKNFWIIKSLPIKSETIMLSKVFFNLLLILPIALISILMLGFSLKIPALSQIMMMGLVTAFAFLMSFLDAVFNLYIPKFDFKNDVEIVKQSASAMLGIFGGFAMLALNGVIYYFARDILDLNIMLFILLILNSLLAFLCYIWMMRISSPLIEKMQA